MREDYHIRDIPTTTNAINLCITFVIMKTLAERMIWARTRANITQQQLAKATGVAQSTIASWESGARETGRKINQVANYLCVNPLWLADGIGQPFSGSEDLDDTALGRIALTDALPVVVADDNHNDYYQIPMVKLRLQAGMTGVQTEPELLDGSTVSIRRNWADREGFRPDKLVGLRVRGESMEPSLHEDDIIIVNLADTKLRDGSVYAVNYEGEAIVKRLSRDAGEWWLMSDNPDQRKYHRKLCRGGDCIVVGRVVRKESTKI
jgi:phage repressor protein C with HTH and peptisase S24 domain